MQDLLMDFDSDKYPAGILTTVSDNYGNYPAILNNYFCYPKRGFYGFENRQSSIVVNPFLRPEFNRKIAQLYIDSRIWGIAVIETIKEKHPYELVCASMPEKSENVFSNPIQLNMESFSFQPVGKYVIAFQSFFNHISNFVERRIEIYGQKNSSKSIYFSYSNTKNVNYPIAVVFGANAQATNAVFSGYIRRCGFYPYSMVKTFCKLYL